MIYPENFEHKIGFDQVREMLNALCISNMGLEIIENLTFETQPDLINNSLCSIDEYLRLMENGVPFVVHDYADLRSELKRIQIVGTIVDFEALFDFKTTLEALSSLASFARSDMAEAFPVIRNMIGNVQVDRKISVELSRLIDDKGEMPDNASPELAALRRDIRQKHNSIDRRIRQIMASAKTAGWTDAKSEITIRDGRMVIPVKASDKRQLRGFIHDESATGQTVYIEPAEIFDTNNEIRDLEYAERREINRILSDFTNMLRPELPFLLHAWDVLGSIDALRAKALLAEKMEAVVPEILQSPIIAWMQARHPLLEQKLKSQSKHIVPLDLNLDSQKRILVISGPNAGGKSVCLKTVGLLQYMLQCGLAVPMKKGSRCGIFNSMFIDIGDEQSLEDDLSTYSSHLLNMKNLLEHADSRSLFLIDEFGTGTEPQLGGAIAEAILLNLNEKHVFGLVTTHYANLKLLADTYEGVVNGAMLFDVRYLQPLYMLMTGRPGSSFAFEIAKKIGFPQEVLDKAIHISGESHLRFEQQLQQLEIEKKEIRKKQHDLNLADNLLNEVVLKYKKLLADLEGNKKEKLAEANAEARALIDKANQRIELTIKEIREAQAEKERTKVLRQELKTVKTELEAQALTMEKKPEPVQELSDLKVGDVVAINDMEVIGELVSVSDTDVVVLFDSVRLRTTADKVQKVKRAELKKALKNRTQYFKDSVANNLDDKISQFNMTLDVRGKRGEEALEMVAKYVDEASLLSIKDISILHGKGNGILRRLIRDFLSHQPNVSAFYDASLETGGTGITRVTLK